MKLSLNLVVATDKKWIEAVMNDFNSFLQDHANCERKASAMATSLVAKYPDRVKIIPDLIDTAIEEMEHFRDVYKIMHERGVSLAKEIKEDIYVRKLIDACRTGREERFLDRLLLGSVIECRGAERFRIVYENLEEKGLKDFYHLLWASEAKHGNIFVKMALNYFPEEVVYKRLNEVNEIEGAIIASLPFTAALH
ncbi:MAG: tRNA-(ms[2]io[6]A)-hydroxylase [Cytophagaceae bacterium]